jgi:site-specific DNA-adenine methylase
MTKNVKQNVLFGRLGNKDTDIKYFKHILPLDVVNIVEPFGGTFSVIRNVYSDDKYSKFVKKINNHLVITNF